MILHGQNWAQGQHLPQAGHGRILALNEEYGFRPLLSVQSFLHVRASGAMEDSTLILGNQLMYITNQEDHAGWNTFIQSCFNKPLIWNQLKSRRHETLEEFNFLWRWMGSVLEVTPTAQAEMVMLSGGWDPVKGYWLQFRGTVPFFTLPDWWDERPSGNGTNPGDTSHDAF